MTIDLTGDFNGWALWLSNGTNYWLIAKFRTLTAAARALTKAQEALREITS